MSIQANNLAKVKLASEEVAIGVLWRFRISPCSPKETPYTTGTIPETFRNRKSVMRSLHPSLSIAATGSKAKDIAETKKGISIEGRKRVLEPDGQVLLMGVRLEVCTAVHLAESQVQFPKHIFEKTTTPKWFVAKYLGNK